MKSQCKTCGVNCEGEYCFRHKPRKPLPKTSSRLSKKLDKSDEVIQKSSEMKDFFLQIWRKRPHYSEVSGKWLGSEPLTIFFHHILPKEKYSGASLDEENIVLLTLEEHEQVEMDMYRFEEINLKRNYLKIKYKL